MGRVRSSSMLDQTYHARGVPAFRKKWTGPWKVVDLLFEGLSVVIEMEDRSTRTTTVSTASLKPLYTTPSDLQQPMEDELAQMAWGCLFAPSSGAAGWPRLLLRSNKFYNA